MLKGILTLLLVSPMGLCQFEILCDLHKAFSVPVGVLFLGVGRGILFSHNAFVFLCLASGVVDMDLGAAPGFCWL